MTARCNDGPSDKAKGLMRDDQEREENRNPWEKYVKAPGDDDWAPGHPDSLRVVVPPKVARLMRAWAVDYSIEANDLAALAITAGVTSGALTAALSTLLQLERMRIIERNNDNGGAD